MSEIHDSCFTNKDRIVGDLAFRDMYPTPQTFTEKDGFFVKSHVHNYDHVQEAHGAGIWAYAEYPDGTRKKLLKDGERVSIPAGVYHSVQVVDDTSWATCIFPKSHVEGEPIEDDGWGEPVKLNMADNPAYC